MFKKALTILLAVCMLSVSAFASTAMLSLETDYESASSATTPAEETVIPEFVYVDNAVDGTQTITYYPAGTTGINNKTNINTTGDYGKKWYFLRMPLEGMETVNEAVLYTTMRYNSGATFYIRALDDEQWASATASLTNNTKTLTADAAFAVPEGEVLCQQSQSSGSATSYELSADALTSYIDSAAKQGKDYVCFAVYFRTNSAKADGCNFNASAVSLTLTGARAVEGISASFIGEKTATLYFDGDTEIGYVTADNPTTNNYSNATENYRMTTNTAGTEDSAVLYLKKDISQYINKDVVKVELVAICRANSSANTMEVRRTDANWIADGENEICYDNQPSLDTDVDAFTIKYNNDPIERPFEITSLVENLPFSQNGVLGLRVRGILGSGKTGYAVQFNGLNKTDGTGARLVITYKDELAASEPVTDEFTYQATIATEGATARLLVGIYGENDVFLGAKASEILTSDGETPLVLPVDLSEYPTATYIKAYMWNGTTLVPYFTPILRTVTVTQ